MTAKKAVVIGSGAGGATAAKELQGDFDVTMLEAGGDFSPLKLRPSVIHLLKDIRVLFDEREIQFAFPHMRVRKTVDGMVLVSGKGLGGSTSIATGSGVRADEPLSRIGVDLDSEFVETENEIPCIASHSERWTDLTRDLFISCEDFGLKPTVTTRMVDQGSCKFCGRCTFGCPEGAKWDSRRFVSEAEANGAKIIKKCKAMKIRTEGNRAVGVEAKKKLRTSFFPADLVVLAAGGFSTPVILANSNITVEPKLFVEPVLCVAARLENAGQNREIPMPFIVEMGRFIISPYFDYLSFYFNKKWRHSPENIVSLMIKLADENRGKISGRFFDKRLTENDASNLDSGIKICKQILGQVGADEDKVFLGTLNACHPGGTLPLTPETAESFHHPSLPENVYVADGSLFPESVGKPHILTIVAMAKRVSRICKNFA